MRALAVLCCHVLADRHAFAGRQAGQGGLCRWQRPAGTGLCAATAGARPLSRRCLIPGTTTVLRCTVTIGISLAFHNSDVFEAAMQEADAALYRGKAVGRNRVEWGAREGALGVA